MRVEYFPDTPAVTLVLHEFSSTMAIIEERARVTVDEERRICLLRVTFKDLPKKWPTWKMDEIVRDFVAHGWRWGEEEGIYWVEYQFRPDSLGVRNYDTIVDVDIDRANQRIADIDLLLTGIFPSPKF